MNKCTGIMGLIFGHRWIEYGRLMTRRQVCIYLHCVHPDRAAEPVPISGRFCIRCGAVTGEKK